MAYLNIEADAIVSWGDRVAAESDLAELVRRLLDATPGVKRGDFLTGKGNHLRGADGRVFATDRRFSGWAPIGESIWELGAVRDGDVVRKINADLAKRAADAIPGKPTSFVAVTLKRVSPDTIKAIEASEPRFDSVRVIGAEQLAQWLAQLPAVTLWFRQGPLRSPLPEGLRSAEAMLREWQDGTTPPLDARLLFIGEARALAAAQLQAWANQPNPPEDSKGVSEVIQVVAQDREAGAAFVAAALCMDPVHGERMRARAVVATTSAALDHLRQLIGYANKSDVVIVYAGPSEDAGKIAGVRVIQIKASGDPISKNKALEIHLSNLPYGALAEDLERHCAIEKQEAVRLARQSKGSITALRLLLGHAPPAWVGQHDIELLCALLLIGKVQKGNNADNALVQRLFSKDLGELVKLYEKLRACDNSPVPQDALGGFIEYTSHEAIWQQLAPRMPSGLLERFADAVIEALSHVEPPFSQGQRIQHEALCTSIARLSASDADLPPLCGRGSRVAQTIVSNLLKDKKTAWWESHCKHLHLLAEAAPKEFLSALEIACQSVDGPQTLYGAHRRHWATPQWGISHSLELLGWYPEHFERVVALILVMYAASDKSSNVSPSPREMLCNLMDAHTPRTLATDSQIVAAIGKLGQAGAPGGELAFEVMLDCEFGRFGWYQDPRQPIAGARLPALAEHAKGRRQGLELREKAISDALTQLLGNDAERWAKALPRLAYSTHMLELLESRRATLQGDTGELCKALRDVKSLQELHAGQDGANLDSTAPQAPTTLDASYEVIVRLLAQLTPDDIIEKSIWLFAWGVSWPGGGLPERLSYEEGEAYAQTEREKALAAVYAERGADGIFKLLGLAEAPETALQTLLKSDYAAELRDRCERQQTNAVSARIFPALEATSGAALAPDMLPIYFEQLQKRVPLDWVRDVAYQITPSLQFYAALDECDPPLCRAYWSDLRYLRELPPDLANAAISKLLEYRNAALVCDLLFRHYATMPAALIERSAEATLTHREVHQTNSSNKNIIFYHVPEVLSHLKREGTDTLQLGKLAARFFLIEPDRPYAEHLLEWLTPVFGQHPEVVAHWISTSRAQGVLSPESQLQHYQSNDSGLNWWLNLEAQSAAKILSRWDSVPFATVDSGSDAQLIEWCKHVYETVEPKTIYLLSNILARGTHETSWPRLATRRILEQPNLIGIATGSMHADRLGDYVLTAKCNRRGVTVRSMGAGGRLERVLAEEHRIAATAMESEFPKTAMLLRKFAESWESDAQWQDALATADARSDGSALDVLTGLDALVAVVLAAAPLSEPASSALIASLLRVNEAEVVVALNSLDKSKLLRRNGTLAINHLALRQWLLQTPSPFSIAGTKLDGGDGIATAYSAAPLASELTSSEIKYVMPLSGGAVRGAVVPPIHLCAPDVAERIPEVGRLLGLWDVLRLGDLPDRSARGIAIARSHLEKML